MEQIFESFSDFLHRSLKEAKNNLKDYQDNKKGAKNKIKEIEQLQFDALTWIPEMIETIAKKHGFIITKSKPNGWSNDYDKKYNILSIDSHKDFKKLYELVKTKFLEHDSDAEEWLEDEMMKDFKTEVTLSFEDPTEHSNGDEYEVSVKHDNLIGGTHNGGIGWLWVNDKSKSQKRIEQTFIEYQKEISYYMKNPEKFVELIQNRF